MAGKHVKKDDGTRRAVKIMKFPIMMLVLGLIFSDYASVFSMGVMLYLVFLMILAILQVARVFLWFFGIFKTIISFQRGKLIIEFYYISRKAPLIR
jgi:hypothetical protein